MTNVTLYYRRDETPRRVLFHLLTSGWQEALEHCGPLLTRHPSAIDRQGGACDITPGRLA
jgi:hypothetical protein